jgi:hypothetical protein
VALQVLVKATENAQRLSLVWRGGQGLTLLSLQAAIALRPGPPAHQ